MKGGALSSNDFRKEERDDEFKFDKIGLRPHIFFGEVEVNNQKYYDFVIFNVEHLGGNEKTCGFNTLKIDDGSRINVVEITGKAIIGNGNGRGKGKGKGNRNERGNNQNESGNGNGRGNNQNKSGNGNGIGNTNYNDGNGTDYNRNKENLISLLDNLLYCKKLTDYRTIRRTIYELLKNTPGLCERLEIPQNFFERDYLPEVITAEGTCVPKGFYKLLPEKIHEFYSEPERTYMQTEVIAETNASKRPNFLKRKVYFTDYEENKYIYFSKKKDSEYYNIAIVCNENNTIYIGIYNPRTGIVKFYPIDKDIFSRFTYPSDFIDLIYLYYPYINSKYIDLKHSVSSSLHIIAMYIKVFEFYSEYISSTIKTSKGDKDINNMIKKTKMLQAEKQAEQREKQQRQQRLNNND